MLATAVGPNLTKLLHDQLGLMFAYGLSEPLRSALVNIARFIPPLLKKIQERLLELLSSILGGQAYKPLGAPPLLGGEAPVPVRDVNAEVCRAMLSDPPCADASAFRLTQARKAPSC